MIRIPTKLDKTEVEEHNRITTYFIVGRPCDGKGCTEVVIDSSMIAALAQHKARSPELQDQYQCIRIVEGKTVTRKMPKDPTRLKSRRRATYRSIRDYYGL